MPCSTSRFGIGQVEGSNRTPLGLHRVAEKIGANAPAGTVFKARKPIGHTSQSEFADARITTRILWLEGLEPGFNQGGNMDSHSRYIYIHGTADQSSIGKPASCGCIHLADKYLLPSFDLLPAGTLVWISRKINIGKKKIRATVAKEVGMKNPAEKNDYPPESNLHTRPGNHPGLSTMMIKIYHLPF